MNESLAGHRVDPCKIIGASAGRWRRVTGVARVPRPSSGRGEWARIGLDGKGREGRERAAPGRKTAAAGAVQPHSPFRRFGSGGTLRLSTLIFPHHGDHHEHRDSSDAYGPLKDTRNCKSRTFMLRGEEFKYIFNIT